MAPETRYARNGDLSIAYQVVGDGPMDLLLVPGFISHVDLWWTDPRCEAFLRRLASFSRLIIFDKPGTGLSDPVSELRSIEQRMEDAHAVLDAAGSEQAALLGLSEGGPMSCVFAATYPERVSALILYGSFSRALPSEEYLPELVPEVLPRIATAMKALEDHWGEGRVVDLFAPSIGDDAAERRFWGLFERAAASPAMVRALNRANWQVDVRSILPAIRVPTLVAHRRGDLVPVEHARYTAAHIEGARLVELDGIDHAPWIGDAGALLDEIEEFLTGAREAETPDRALLTVLFTDIVDSTATAARLGDAQWRALLERHDVEMRRQVARFRGHAVKSTGDGFLATFDGPARAIRCAQAVRDELASLGLAVRAGIHTGECEQRGDDVSGIAVHLGARVCGRARAGEILVSSTVKELVVGSDLAFADRGVAELKGVPGQWRLFALDDGPTEPRAAVDPEREFRRGDRAALRVARRAPGAARAAVRLARRRRPGRAAGAA